MDVREWLEMGSMVHLILFEGFEGPVAFSDRFDEIVGGDGISYRRVDDFIQAGTGGGIAFGLADDIAHAAEERIRERVDKVARVFVHVEAGDPAGSDCPDMNR